MCGSPLCIAAKDYDEKLIKKMPSLLKLLYLAFKIFNTFDYICFKIIPSELKIMNIITGDNFQSVCHILDLAKPNG